MADGERGTASFRTVKPPSVALPTGGGAVRGIGEKFGANPVNGTATMTVPISVPPARGSIAPALSLAYDSGHGNGPFGFGWTLALPSISRRTDKGIPRYDDERESDVFVLAGSEDLVPVGEPRERDGYRIRSYRPRIEGLFARIERWSSLTEPGDVHWRTWSGENMLSVYGLDQESRVADPEHPERIFSWLICQTRDDNGNVVAYGYRPDDGAGVEAGAPHERNRGPADAVGRTAYRYPSTIRYGNRVPLLDDHGRRPRHLARRDIDTAEWMFEVAFDYGDHDPDTPGPEPDRDWPLRDDAFSTYRSGFELRTTRSCRRVLLFHSFPDEPQVGRDCLVQSLDLDYTDPTTAGADGARYSLLTGVTRRAYRRSLDGYESRSIPTVEFGYSLARVGHRVEQVGADAVANLPAGVDGTAYRWTDLHGEGTAGVLTQQAGAWFYSRNLTPDADRVTFSPPQVVDARPNIRLEAAQIMDVDGDGVPDIAVPTGTGAGFARHDADGGWSPWQTFAEAPIFDIAARDTRLIDLTGDGQADILITGDDAFVWYPSRFAGGFGQAFLVPAIRDEELGPAIVFDDGTESIHLADMSGDGLTDLVRVRNGEVCYWPNLGYGRFGSKVTMDHSPLLGSDDLFAEQRILFADIDGSGTADLVRIAADGVRLYFNESGNGWGPPVSLERFPAVSDLSTITPIDLLGNGTACLVWSSPLPGDAAAPLRYVQLMKDGKPHLLTRVVNNLGAETNVRYAPSTRFALRDRRAGMPWLTTLPFVVHVVDRVETIDRIGRLRFIAGYAYHFGSYDAVEREFRGFGMVEQWDTEIPEAGRERYDNERAESWVPPVHTKTWYHTGTYLGREQLSHAYARGPGGYYREPGEAADGQALLDDTVLPPGLTLGEEREAARALKGSMLHREVYALDGTPSELHPYVVTEQSQTVTCLQRQGANRHAVFFTAPREALTLQYEREPHDPRVAHTLTLEVDRYGNVLRRAAVGYGRRRPSRELTTDADRLVQTRTLVSYTESDTTNSIDDPVEHPDDYRVPLAAESRTYELTGLRPSRGRRFRFGDWSGDDFALVRRTTEVAYEKIPGDADTAPARRLVDAVRELFRPDDLGERAGDPGALLPVGVLEPHALPGQSFHLTFTQGLLEAAFVRDGAALIPDPARVLEHDGGYVPDTWFPAGPSSPRAASGMRWWRPSARWFLSSDDLDARAEWEYARRHFFRGVRQRDPLHRPDRPAESVVRFDPYDLLVVDVADALGNRTTAGARDGQGTIIPAVHGNDYRVLMPRTVMDPNRNRASAEFDILGMVVATAVQGTPKQSIGDELGEIVTDLPPGDLAAAIDSDDPATVQSLLGTCSTRILYDLDEYARTAAEAHPRPATVYTLARETHVSELEPGQATRVQRSYSYSDGFGREVQKKLQAEVDPAAGEARWVGSGWTIFTNKGKPFRSFEPFFTLDHRFEFGVTVGVSSTIFYDPLDRVIATVHPNHTYSKEVFDAWAHRSWDLNDTVLIDPRDDPDVSGYVTAFLDEAEPGTQTWYAERVDGALGAHERRAAELTAEHAATPLAEHLDTLGRTVISVAHNGFAMVGEVRTPMLHTNRIVLDIEGNTLAIRDASATGGETGRLVSRTAVDLAGGRLRQTTMDGGDRWTLTDTAEKVMLAWDARGHRMRTVYDALHRPVAAWLTEPDAGGGSPELLSEKLVYGERDDDVAANLRGRLVSHRDQAGMVTNLAYDFQGNLLRSAREVAREYRDALDWSGPVDLLPGSYETETTFDALKRPVTITTPAPPGEHPATQRRRYNEANLLDRVDVRPSTPLDDEPADWEPLIADLAYDAKGQRVAVVYGNGAETRYDYDPLTFRLVRLTSTRRSDSRLQDLRIVYDPMGNVSHLGDDAKQTLYFRNRRVSADADYAYDPLYRLTEASGREQVTGSGARRGRGRRQRQDPPPGRLPLPQDGASLARYVERYAYDAVGNIEQIRHRRHAQESRGWTRSYRYDDPSALAGDPGIPSNRLTAVTDGREHPGQAGSGEGLFAYDEHGNMTRMPHLDALAWDFKDQLHSTRRTRSGDRAGGSTYHVYDAAGQRVRTVTERAGGAIRSECLTLGGFELFSVHAGRTAGLVRATVHVLDNQRRFALIESRNDVDDGSVARLIRYQLGNHLDSVTVELDERARVISFEEFTAFGGTTLTAVRRGRQAPKRYRFAGKERDESSGLYYFGARYYAPWLGRWTACDPAGHADGTDPYVYVRNNPVRLTDPTGMLSWGQVFGIAAAVVVGTIVTVATAGLAGPIVGTVAAGIIGGIVGGAVGAGVGEAIEAKVDGREAHIGRAMIIGGITGGLFAGAGSAISAGLRTAAGEAFAARVGSTVVGQFVSKTLDKLAQSAAGKLASRATAAIADPAERVGQSIAKNFASTPGAKAAAAATTRAAATEANVQGAAGVTRETATAGNETFSHSVGWRGSSNPLGPTAGGAQIEAEGALRLSTGIKGQWGEGAYAFEGGVTPGANGSAFQFKVPPQTAVERVTVPGSSQPIVRLVPPPGSSTVPIRITGNNFPAGSLEAIRPQAQAFGMLSKRVPFGYPGVTADVTGVTGGAAAGTTIIIGPSKPVDETTPSVPSVGVQF